MVRRMFAVLIAFIVLLIACSTVTPAPPPGEPPSQAPPTLLPDDAPPIDLPSPEGNPPHPIQDERFGLMLGGYDGIWPDDYARAASIGAGVARLGFYWPHVEYECGVLDFAYVDEQVAAAEENGLSIIMTVSGSSPCACSLGEVEDYTICPPYPDAFRDFMEIAATRYQGRIRAWEIWNEPEQPTYWIGAPDPAGYASLLQAAYEGVKAGDPDATVLFAATGFVQYDYVEQVLQALNGATAFDAVAAHPYRFPAGPHEPIEVYGPWGPVMATLSDELSMLQDLFESYGYGRPDLYLTELGWGTNHAENLDGLNTLDEQAQHIYDTITLFKTDSDLAHVKAITFFIERDSQSSEGSFFSYFGLFYEDGSPKPAAQAFYEAVASAFPSLIVDRNANLGSARSISEFIAVQGAPLDPYDPFEAQAWKDLRLRAGDSLVLLNDEFYFPEGGMHVIRSETPPTDCALGARGPLGPQGDLWLCPDQFEAFLEVWPRTVGVDFAQYLNISVMPRTLSYNPESPHWMLMSPGDPEEWYAVIREAARYLAEKGWTEPTIWLYPEFETWFYGKDRPFEDGTLESSLARAEDYAELYIITQNALREHLPQARLIGATSPTYSRDITRDVAQNPTLAGIEDWLEALQRLDPSFVPTAVGWQGYYWYGLDGFGPERLLEGANHIQSVLRNLGYPDDTPQYLGGWNGTFGNPEAVDGSMSDDARLMKEAAHLASSVIDMLEIGSGQRRIHSALYYTWNLDTEYFPDYRCGFPYQSLVSTIHDRIYIGGGAYGSDCEYIPASEVQCKRATYHAMKFLSDLQDGDFIGAGFTGNTELDTSALRVAAVRQEDATLIVVAHRDGETIPSLRLEAQGLTPGGAYLVAVRNIHAAGNTCAETVSQMYGLNADASGFLFMPLPPIEGGVMQIVIQPQ